MLEEKMDELHRQMKHAIEDENLELFLQLAEQRKSIIEQLLKEKTYDWENHRKKEETLLAIIEEKKEHIQTFLTNQTNRHKAMRKYGEFQSK